MVLSPTNFKFTCMALHMYMGVIMGKFVNHDKSKLHYM